VYFYHHRRELGLHLKLAFAVRDPSSRAERTPEVAAVSGLYRESGESLKTLPGIPRTNLSISPTADLTPTISTPSESIKEADTSCYLDSIVKSRKSTPKLGSIGFTKKCGLWAIVGECENGHRFATRLFCEKPYCPICRDIIHHRKIARLLPEAQQLLPAGYWVIRPPNELQVWYLNRGGRRCFIRAVIKALKSLGYLRGLIFIHYFGDDPTKYAFHLNVLVDGGYLEPEVLEELKRKLRRLIYPQSVIKRWGDTLAVHYSFKPTQAQVYQALEYCTKPTFTQLEGNEQLADSIRGEHTIRRWGKWDEEPKWQLSRNDRKLQSLVSLEQGKCPECGKPIKWSKRSIPFVLVLAQGGSQITAGYYTLPPIRPPPAQRRQPTNLIELPDSDPRKRSNRVREEVEKAGRRVNFYNSSPAYRRYIAARFGLTTQR